MATDRNDLLTVLKKELRFLEEGGYRETRRAPWRPQFIFQDSPTCLNFDPSHAPRPCSDCAVLQLVPEHLRVQKIPCRYIPIASDGRTIDWFYRNGTQQELELVFANWLKSAIALCEREEAERKHPGEIPEVHVKATSGQSS
jgi:hypothetical protein